VQHKSLLSLHLLTAPFFLVSLPFCRLHTKYLFGPTVTNVFSPVQQTPIITSGPPFAVATFLIFLVSSTATLWFVSIPQATKREPSGEKLRQATPFLSAPLKEYLRPLNVEPFCLTNLQVLEFHSWMKGFLPSSPVAI